MHSLSVVPAASNAAPSPVRTASTVPDDPDAFPSAYAAAKAHPAYREAAAIRDELVKLRDLCEQFTDSYHPDTIRVYLHNLGFRTENLSEDFELVHRDVLGAVWMLDILRSSIDPAIVLPFDLVGDQPRKDGAA